MSAVFWSDLMKNTCLQFSFFLMVFRYLWIRSEQLSCEQLYTLSRNKTTFLICRLPRSSPLLKPYNISLFASLPYFKHPSLSVQQPHSQRETSVLFRNKKERSVKEFKRKERRRDEEVHSCHLKFDNIAFLSSAAEQ